MADLESIGKILAAIDGVVAIVFAVLGLIGSAPALGVDANLNLLGALGAVLSAILAIVGGLINFGVGVDKVKVDNVLLLGILVLMVGLVLTTVIGIIAGIILILDAFV